MACREDDDNPSQSPVLHDFRGIWSGRLIQDSQVSMKVTFTFDQRQRFAIVTGDNSSVRGDFSFFRASKIVIFEVESSTLSLFADSATLTYDYEFGDSELLLSSPDGRFYLKRATGDNAVFDLAQKWQCRDSKENDWFLSIEGSRASILITDRNRRSLIVHGELIEQKEPDEVRLLDLRLQIDEHDQKDSLVAIDMNLVREGNGRVLYLRPFNARSQLRKDLTPIRCHPLSRLNFFKKYR